MPNARSIFIRGLWGGLLSLLGGAPAFGQAYLTPVRVSWTEDPTTTATISWDTPEPARGTVRYGLSTNYSDTLHDGGGVHKHVIVLRDLQPATRYFYEASTDSGFLQEAAFRTAPAQDQPLHFVFHGDLQGGIDEAGAQGVSDRIVQEDPQWVQHLGDMAEEAFSGTGFTTWDLFFRICSNELAQTVFMPMMGNHDAAPGSDFTRGLYHRIFTLPDPSLGHGYYGYTVGNVRFMILNSEAALTGQAEWLAREMQAAVNDPNLTWTIALWHRPPYSYGEREGWDEGKDNWSPVLVKYEADWMVAGHSHNYQRMVPIRGVRYLVAGGAGGRLYWSATNHPTHEFATTCYHHVSAHITNEVMQVRGIRSDGKVFDTVVVTNRRQVRIEPAFPVRGQPAKVMYRATEGPLAAAHPVYIHLGQDAFTNAFASEPMTWNPSSQRWEYEFTVPVSATSRVAFVFHDGANIWHNNYAHDWQALLARTTVAPDPPVAGSNVTIRYEADMGVMAGAAQVSAWVSFNDGQFPAMGGIPMVHVSGARWECTLLVPPYARSMKVAFSANNGWDDDWRRNWIFPVFGATEPAWPPAPIVPMGTPVITDNPDGPLPDNIGDNFDLVMQGPPLISQEVTRGFGDFGQVWLNADATNLYLGGYGLDLGGTNNVPIIFLSLDTLTDNAWTLWHKSGLPNALDFLHNVRFTEPMDLAIVLGDQFADRANYTNFTYGGYNFGQGIFYIGTNSATFFPMADAQLSQFYGTGTVATTTQGSPDQSRTTRWEAALPWASLNATGPESVSNLFICGVIGSSSVQTNDRYLSRVFLGDRAWGLRDEYIQYGYNTVYLRPQRVNLLHADLRGDGISNAWRQEYFGTPDGPPAEEDSDEDGQDNRAEEIAGTRPLDPGSFFAVEAEPANGGEPWAIRWPFAPGRIYDVYFTPGMLEPFQWRETILNTNRWEVPDPGFFHPRVRKQPPPGY